MIIVTGDIFRPDRDPTKCHQASNIQWLDKTLKQNLKPYFTIYPTTPLPLEEWLLLDQIKPCSILEQHVKNDDVLIGFELPRSVIEWCKYKKIAYIDIIVSPIRFQKEDRILGIESNFFELKESDIVSEDFLLSKASEYSPLINLCKTEYDLIIGQTDIDRSLIDSHGNLTKLDDFVNRIDFNRNIIFKPHPLDLNNIPNFVHERNIPVLIGVDTYSMLSDPLLNKVISISSSVTYECEYFNKPYERFIERKLERYTKVWEKDFFNRILKRIKLTTYII